MGQEPSPDTGPPDAGPPRCDDAFQIVSSLQARAFERCVPINATIELTLRCNLRCVHCYNFDRDAPPAPDACAPELGDDEILGAMRALRDEGCLFLTLTGGEVFSHPSLFAFLDEARRLSFAVQLLSNGTLLRPGVVARLAGYENLLGTSLSLYGATAETHDGLTRQTGSFRRTWDGARRLQAKGISVRLKLIGMRANAHELGAMMAAATREGFPFLIDLAITSRHDGTHGSAETRVDRAQLEALYRGPLAPYVPKGRHPVTAENFACNCARAMCAISATGDVYPCISVPISAGNLRRQPFAEIWRGSPLFQRIRGLALDDFAKCAPCAHKDWCTRSRGAAVTATGDYTGADPFTCEAAEVAHALYPLRR